MEMRRDRKGWRHQREIENALDLPTYKEWSFHPKKTKLCIKSHITTSNFMLKIWVAPPIPEVLVECLHRHQINVADIRYNKIELVCQIKIFVKEKKSFRLDDFDFIE